MRIPRSGVGCESAAGPAFSVRKKGPQAGGLRYKKLLLGAAGMAHVAALFSEQVLDDVGAMRNALGILVFRVAEGGGQALRAFIALIALGDNADNLYVAAIFGHIFSKRASAGTGATDHENIDIEAEALADGTGFPGGARRKGRDMAFAQFLREREHETQFAIQDEYGRWRHTVGFAF